jgi:hypothetical protein
VTTVALGWGLGVLINPADVAAVADGVLVNAVWAVGQMVTRPRESRRAAAGMETAGWMDTERLIRDALADVAASREIPVLSEQEAAELTAALRRHEVQGALQVLLAVRLTDAPELEAAQARQAIRLALSGSVPPPLGMTDRRAPRRQGQSLRGVPLPGFETAGTRYAPRLSEYFDDKVCGLVAMLEGRVGFAGLAQVRAEAYNARIVALLGAIERQVMALADPGRDERDEAEFLERYRPPGSSAARVPDTTRLRPAAARPGRGYLRSHRNQGRGLSRTGGPHLGARTRLDEDMGSRRVVGPDGAAR